MTTPTSRTKFEDEFALILDEFKDEFPGDQANEIERVVAFRYAMGVAMTTVTAILELMKNRTKTTNLTLEEQLFFAERRVVVHSELWTEHIREINADNTIPEDQDIENMIVDFKKFLSNIADVSDPEKRLIEKTSSSKIYDITSHDFKELIEFCDNHNL